jgi:SAM-dependent methyltransferase
MIRVRACRQLYRERRLAQAHPDLERLALGAYLACLEGQPDEAPMLDLRLARLERLLDLECRRSVLVVGCGPRPRMLKLLLERSFDARGVEIVPSFVQAARDYVNRPDRVLEGAAESLPLPDASQNLVFSDSVLEHVTSPTRSLDEMFRVLRPGGVAYITTTNRYRFSLTGDTEEYRVPYFNWLPASVKESFVFHHLHYEPRLANYTPHPAVHWFTYAELCSLGRRSGFSRFYSALDLAEGADWAGGRSTLKPWLMERVKCNPWLRAIALSQVGGTIIMLKQ